MSYSGLGPVGDRFTSYQASLMAGVVIPQFMAQSNMDLANVLHGGLPTTGMEESDMRNPYYMGINQGLNNSLGTQPLGFPGPNYFNGPAFQGPGAAFGQLPFQSYGPQQLSFGGADGFGGQGFGGPGFGGPGFGGPFRGQNSQLAFILLAVCGGRSCIN